MMKRLLFPMTAFVVLTITAALSPEPAQARLCNGMVCIDYTCQMSSSGPMTSCFNIFGACIWDICPSQE